ncbi:poly-gamma-glutamate hydrolase family protein [Priestia aryabhattai]|uniref:poly-gamma-glutamate hydrolase family protein n=1 Tax=Priestia aryabhattai TaxID=412384 RepID=UPI00399FF8AC
MADMFNNYAELSAVYTEGTDYKVTLTKKDKAIGITAYHGGGIEIGSTELMQYVYEKRTTWSWYGFEGLLSADNSNLHITSTHFDEPRGMDFIGFVNRAVSFHGASGTDPITYIGGMDTVTREFIRARLESKGFVVEYASTESGIAGEQKDNFVNRPPKGGVQLEMSTQLRKSFFLNDDWSKTARSNKANWTQKLKDYGDAVIEGVEMALALKLIGTGQLSLSDLNDAIISGIAPTNPTVGALWIDESDPTNKQLKKWDGSQWVAIGYLNPELGTVIEDIIETLGNMANDGIIDFQERQIIRDKLTEVLGYVPYDKTPFLSTYANKTSGATGGNGHVAKYYSGTANPNPTSVGTEFVQSSYDAIKTLNGTTSQMGTVTTSGQQAYQIYAFNMIRIVEDKYGTIPKSTTADKVAWIEANIANLNFNWHGRGSSPTGNKASVGGWVGGSWDATPSTNTTASIAKVTKNYVASIPNLIDANGIAWYGAWADASDGTTASTILTDYVELEVTMKSTLPTSTSLDTFGYGDFYNTRQSAKLAGLVTTDAKYVEVATDYTALKTYLEGLSPINAWDTSDTNKDQVITVSKAVFNDKWLQYYEAVKALITATQEQLKKNVDNSETGGTNYISNGNFEIPIANALWKNKYVGQTIEIVDIGTETPPFANALHGKNTTNGNTGIDSTILWDGAIAGALQDREVTIQFWLKYQNVVMGVNNWNYGRFGELVVEGEKSDGTKVYSYLLTTNGYISGTDMTWKKYTKTIKLALPSGAVKITRVSFKHWLEGCTGEFWTTGIKLEFGNKASDWSQSPLDVQQRLSNVEFKVSDTEIISKVTTSQTYLSAFQAVNARVDNVGVGGENLVDGSEFKTLPVAWNGAGLLLVEGTGGQPNSLLVSKPAGASYAFTLWGTMAFRKDLYYTISFEAKTDGTLDQFNYIYLRGNGVSNYQLPTSITIDKTNTTGFVPYSITVKAPYDFPANAGVMVGTTGQTASFEIRKVKIERGDRASDWKPSLADQSVTIIAGQDSGTMVTNSQFSLWGGTHSKYPTGMTHWNGTFYGQRELTLTKNGGNALRFKNTGTNDAGASLQSGFFKPNLANTKYLMVEVDFYVVSGTDLSASCILIDWAGMATYRRTHKLQEMVTETITTGKWYSARKLFLRPSDTLTGYTGMQGFLMANYSGAGTKAEKDIIFDRLSVREATAEEIKAYSADLTIADMMSDMKITPVEKSTLKQTWDNIKSEYAILVSQAQASAVTYSVYDGAYAVLNGSTPKIESEILANMTTTYSFASTTARDTFKTQLNTYYNEALRLRRTIDDITASAKNLILNSTFNMTDEQTGLPTIWSNINAKWSVKDPETDKPNSSILYAGTTTGNTTNLYYSAYSNWFTVKQGDIFTFSLDFKTTSATAWDLKFPFIIEFYDGSTTPVRVQYRDTSVTDLGITTVADNTWYRGSYTIQVTSATAIKGRVRLSLTKNGDLSIREVQVQRSNKMTDYAPAPEDTSTQVFLLENRVANVQQIIDGGGIIDIITNSSEYQLALDGKADADSLANYATSDELTEAISGVNSATDNKIAGIDFTPYVEQTVFDRTATDITAKFANGGGINMLKNSLGFSDLDFWTLSSGGFVPTIQNNELDELGYSSGFATSLTKSGYIMQDVYTTIGQQYTFSYYLNKTIDNATNGFAGVDIVDGAGVTLKFLGKGTNGGVTDGYEFYTYTFTALTSVTKIRVTGGTNAEAIFTGLMFNIGDQPLQWSMHPQEIYNTNIRMDLNGIHVVQMEPVDSTNPTGDKKVVGFTVVRPDRFAGYYDVDGDGIVDETVGGTDEVFRMDKDEFVMKKANVKEEITMGTIKVIKISSTASTGWAFVSNQTS